MKPTFVTIWEWTYIRPIRCVNSVGVISEIFCSSKSLSTILATKGFMPCVNSFIRVQRTDRKSKIVSKMLEKFLNSTLSAVWVCIFYRSGTFSMISHNLTIDKSTVDFLHEHRHVRQMHQWNSRFSYNDSTDTQMKNLLLSILCYSLFHLGQRLYSKLKVSLFHYWASELQSLPQRLLWFWIHLRKNYC